MAAAIVLQGCAALQEPPEPQDPYPDSRPPRTLESYLRMRTVVLDDGNPGRDRASTGRRWVVSPAVIREFVGEFLNFEFSVEEGISGSILHVTQDRTRLWIATSNAVQSLDKDLHFVRTYLEEQSLQAVFVAPYAIDQAVVLTARGAALVDAATLGTEIISAPDLDIRQVLDAVLYGENLWVATYRGLERFSIPWKRWDRTFGGKALQRAAVLRLELVDDYVGNEKVGETLYAVTAGDLFVYRPTFDDWERLGL